MTLTDLLLRDPDHPEVRALLELRYRQVCAEQQLLAKVLRIPTKSQRYILQPNGYLEPTCEKERQ